MSTPAAGSLPSIVGVRRLVHLITPGDHYSPSTGSAIPTVVHGLSSHHPSTRPRPAVLVATGTYPDRYDSAEAVEYPLPPPSRLPPAVQRYADPLLGLVGLRRPFNRRPLRHAIAAEVGWSDATLVAHNAPQAIPLHRGPDRTGILYAHNRLFRTYSRREAGRILDRVGAVVCVSSYLAEDTAARLPTRIAERIAVVHNGVDTRLFQRRGAVGQREQLEVLFVGRMIPDKGPDVLVEALRLLGRRDVRLTLVGSSGFDANATLTPFELKLRRSAEPLPGGVRHLPFSARAAVARLMADADVVVVPSRCPEAFALTALEGMAAGAAVVASEVGGVPETVQGVGLLVPPSDAHVLAGALEALADDRDLAARSGAAGRVYAECHDWSHAAVRLDRVVQDLT